MPVTLTRIAPLFALVSLPSISVSAHAADREVQVLRYETIAADFKSVQAASAAKSNLASTMRFTAFGKTFLANLEPNTRLTLPAGARAQAFRGALSGRDNSWVRITRNGDEVHGLIFDGTELLAIEPAAAVAPNEKQGLAVFRLADTKVELGADFCDASDTPQNGLQMYQGLGADSKRILAQLQSSGASMRLELSALLDAAFRARYASDAEASNAAVARLNNVDGIFSSQVGVQVAVTQIVPVATNALSTGTSADALLQSLSRMRNTSPNLYATGITHLFTGVDLDGSTVGIAYIDTVCSQQYGVSLAEARDRGVWFDSLVAAHEIGHSFGSPHDGAGQCAATPANSFLMSATINGTDQFSQCSLDIIRARVRTASCLAPIPLPDISVSADLGTYHVAPTQTLALSIAVSNIGNADSPNSRVQLTIPPALTIATATVDGGSCSVGGGAVVCDLGTVIARETRSVQLALSGAQTGSYTIAAVTSASGNLDSNNDSGTLVVHVDPSVDVAVTMTAPETTMMDQSFNATISVINKSATAVSNLAVDITLPTGMTLTGTAELDGVACQTQFQTIRCTSAVLAGSRTITGSLSLMAHDAGPQLITASVDGAYVDPQPQDNIAQRSINIASAPSAAPAASATPSPSSGGGALTLLWLLAMMSLRAVRRR